jgi:hypothetical protein
VSITAAITLSSATTTTGKQVTATCTITNAGASDVTVQSCSPTGFVSASTYRDFVTADWTDTPGADFADLVVSAVTGGERGSSSVEVSYDGSSLSEAVPQTGLVELGDPAVTLTLPPSWYGTESATISATSEEITVTNAGQPQFPSVSLNFGVPFNAVDATDKTVPAGGTLALQFGVVPLAPGRESEAQAYDIGATVVTSGSVTTYATVSTLTVSPAS